MSNSNKNKSTNNIPKPPTTVHSSSTYNPPLNSILSVWGRSPLTQIQPRPVNSFLSVWGAPAPAPAPVPAPAPAPVSTPAPAPISTGAGAGAPYQNPTSALAPAEVRELVSSVSPNVNELKKQAYKLMFTPTATISQSSIIKQVDINTDIVKRLIRINYYYKQLIKRSEYEKYYPIEHFFMSREKLEEIYNGYPNKEKILHDLLYPISTMPSEYKFINKDALNYVFKETSLHYLVFGLVYIYDNYRGDPLSRGLFSDIALDLINIPINYRILPYSILVLYCIAITQYLLFESYVNSKYWHGQNIILIGLNSIQKLKNVFSLNDLQRKEILEDSKKSSLIEVLDIESIMNAFKYNLKIELNETLANEILYCVGNVLDTDRSTINSDCRVIINNNITLQFINENIFEQNFFITSPFIKKYNIYDIRNILKNWGYIHFYSNVYLNIIGSKVVNILKNLKNHAWTRRKHVIMASNNATVHNPRFNTPIKENNNYTSSSTKLGIPKPKSSYGTRQKGVIYIDPITGKYMYGRKQTRQNITSKLAVNRQFLHKPKHGLVNNTLNLVNRTRYRHEGFLGRAMNTYLNGYNNKYNPNIKHITNKNSGYIPMIGDIIYLKNNDFEISGTIIKKKGNGVALIRSHDNKYYFVRLSETKFRRVGHIKNIFELE